MKKILFYCITLLCVFGCRKSNNNSGNQNATDIFPNKVGDTWVYLVNDTTVSKFNGQSSTIAQYNMTITIIGSVPLPESIHGINLPKNLEANIWVYNYPGVTDTNYVFQKNDTLFFFDINQPSSSYSRKYIIPLSLHNSWQYTVGGFGEVNVDSQVDINVEQNIFYNAFHIYGFGGVPDKGFSVEEWIENNVGIVKRYLKTEDISPVNRFIKWSLLGYHLK